MSAAPPADIDLEAQPAPVRAAFLAERAAREQLQAQVAALAEQNQRLEHLVREFRQALHGRKCEKLSADERQLAFEELETAVAEIETAKQAAEGASGEPRPRGDSPRRNLGRLPKELPRVERVVEPESILCPCGCGPMTRIGEDRTERLDIVPAQFQVIATIRPTYACRACAGKVAQAPAPAHLIEGALPTEATLAHVLVSKYADHCPLYRQAQIYARNGLALQQFSLCGRRVGLMIEGVAG